MKQAILCGIILLIFPLLKGHSQGEFSYSDEELFQDTGEIYFKFHISSNREVFILSEIIYIDRVDDNTVYAYSNQKQFAEFLELGYQYILLTHPGKRINPLMKDKIDLRDAMEWDFYPTYEAYTDLMEQFQDNYPDICRYSSIVTLPGGREILFLKISDNVDVPEDEPQFLYTSTMHGDELAGYILMLHLADYLLSNYGTDPEVTDLVDNLEIWINPLANPDGTYAGGNNTVYGATRTNANYVDLNRNFPDPEDGPHPDGNEWQPETLAFMQFAGEHNFVMAANFHGGNELVNYPWDTWVRRAADNNWWIFVSYEYADTVHACSNGYFYGEGDGVTNGYDWYSISGGRQDYMNFFHQCRECTIELSNVKILPETQLPLLWEYNRKSFLNYMKQSLFGVRGVITDSVTGNPLKAKIDIEGHDLDSSHVYSSDVAGNYHRLLYQGTYDISFRSKGYFPKICTNIDVVNYESTRLDVAMVPGDLIADFVADDTEIAAGETIKFTDMSYGDLISWDWTFDGGTPSSASIQHPEVVYDEPGVYTVSLTVSDGENQNTFMREGYIHVNLEYVLSNSTVSVCSGIFYDTGGDAGNYSDNEDIVMTFLPGEENKAIKIEFQEFHVEYHETCGYDWLRIYNGQSTASPVIGTYCGTDSPGSVTADNPQGALTFHFSSDSYVNEPGWQASINCVDIVGVQKINRDAGIYVYPNPARSVVFVEMRGDEVTLHETTIELWSLDGSVHRTFEEDISGNTTGSVMINVDLLPCGVYFLQVKRDGGVSTCKLIII